MDAETLPYALDLVASSGICLSPEKRAALRNSLLLVRRDYRFEQVRLWGRIQGIRGAYYIAEGLGPDRAGIRSRLYSLNGVDWSLLPPPSEEIIAMTAALKGRFQGDPSYEYESSEKKEEGERPYEEEIGLLMESLQLLKLVTQLFSESGFPIDFACQKVTKGDHVTPGHFNHHKYEQVAKHPNFDGDAVMVPLVKEEIRLVATIHQIDQEVGIVPRGAYVKSPLGPVHVNRSFEGLSLTEAKKLSSYFHFTEPVKLKNKTLLEKADLDPAIDFLDSLEHDIPKD